MKILVYVEGPSDQYALSALLRPVIESGRARGIGIKFFPQGSKYALMDGVPRRAADHLADHPGDCVVALPDLYPMSRHAGTRNAHASFADLEKLLRDRFDHRAESLGLSADVRQRFRIHCLKHDLEVLLLAAPDQLRSRLGTEDALVNAWRKPVEDQDDERPPKRVVEELFKEYRKRAGYVDTLDAPWVLDRANLAAVEKACPQRFGPFVADLRAAVTVG